MVGAEGAPSAEFIRCYMAPPQAGGVMGEGKKFFFASLQGKFIPLLLSVTREF